MVVYQILMKFKCSKNQMQQSFFLECHSYAFCKKAVVIWKSKLLSALKVTQSRLRNSNFSRLRLIFNDKRCWASREVFTVSQRLESNQVKHVLPRISLEALMCNVGEQGWRSGESTRLPPMCPGFGSRTQCRMWVEFVGSLPCSERFFPGYFDFPLSTKTTI